MNRVSLARLLFGLAAVLFLVGGGAALAEHHPAAGLVFVAAMACLAASAGLSQSWKGFSFSLCVGVFLMAAMFFPSAFRSWGSFELKRLMIPLIQIIMFGMGAMLSLADFSRVLKMPRAVLVGMVLQFTIMPTIGAGLAAAFGFPPQVAAGVVLVGSCPGGVASNVMAFLARGNVALSVTMTACSTLASPLMTPLMMKLLAGRYVEIKFLDMMVNILEMIVLPIVAGLIANSILKWLQLRGPWLDRLLSRLAMGAICFIIAIITSLSRDQLLQVGLALIAASILHNGLGYLLGYGGAWLSGLSESDRRTVAIEVGMQNGGMASGLAVGVLNSSDAALAPAIFGPWMNISGSILASWWRSRPPDSNGDADRSKSAGDEGSRPPPTQRD